MLSHYINMESSSPTTNPSDILHHIYNVVLLYVYRSTIIPSKFFIIAVHVNVAAFVWLHDRLF